MYLCKDIERSCYIDDSNPRIMLLQRKLPSQFQFRTYPGVYAKRIVVPYGVTQIGVGCFEDWKCAEEVIIPCTVKKILGYAFRGCTSLKSISIPDSVEYIGDYAFEDCTSLKDIRLSNNLKDIGKCAFTGTVIEFLELPKSYRVFEPETIYDMNNLKYLVCRSEESYYHCLHLCKNIEKIRFDGMQYMKDYSLILSSKIKEIVFTGDIKEFNATFLDISHHDDLRVLIPRGTKIVNSRGLNWYTLIEYDQ